MRKFDSVDIHVLDEGQYMYCGEDIAKALGYNDVIEALCDLVKKDDTINLHEARGDDWIEEYRYINEGR